VAIVSNRRRLQRILPDWYYGLLADAGLRRIQRERNCHFPHLEHCLGELAPRPLLMIHGGADTYIKPDMAQVLFRHARGNKEFWLVEGAKHNQALAVAGDVYRQRILDFFHQHLALQPVTEHSLPAPARSGISLRPPKSQTVLRLAEAGETMAERR
jgi:fermentation-respiration switch protein FrsA (DUF1100 family)